MSDTPLWRKIVILVLIVLGVIYALPNLYGDDTAIQISAKGTATLDTAVQAKVRSLLTHHNISIIGVSHAGDNLLFRLPPSKQALAQELVQADLGSQYVVALNLAPKTPDWLRALGAVPMKLGLDLRGGIHFLMQVNTNAMLKQRLEGDIHTITNELREKMLRYSAIIPDGETGITLQFRDAPTRNQAYDLLSNQPSFYQSYTFSKSQTGSIYRLKATLIPAAVTKDKVYAVQQNLNTLRQRINQLGVSEPVISQQGEDQISVDLPGIQDTARAKEMIGKVATLRIQFVDQKHDPIEAAKTGIIPFGDTLYPVPAGMYQYQGQPSAYVLLKNQIILTGKSITSAEAGLDPQKGEPSVNVTVAGSDVSFFNEITAKNYLKLMATVYVETVPVKTLVNGQVKTTYKQNTKIISIATQASPTGLPSRFQISGAMSMAEAQNLAFLLRSGAYVAPLSFVQEQVVGPSLGARNIEMGVLSCEIGMLLVIVFMAFYYRVFGLIADVALILNVIFVVAIQSVLGFTMTLPGIAALVLTVGMAVDANVLIDERIREELRLGMSPLAAIRAGYDRAFTTIVDANVTTLIVAVVLFCLGTGPVKGFAVTLTIGILTSMVTAIFFTRSFVDMVYGRKQHLKSISIGIKVEAKH